MSIHSLAQCCIKFHPMQDQLQICLQSVQGLVHVLPTVVIFERLLVTSMGSLSPHLPSCRLHVLYEYDWWLTDAGDAQHTMLDRSGSLSVCSRHARHR